MAIFKELETPINSIISINIRAIAYMYQNTKVGCNQDVVIVVFIGGATIEIKGKLQQITDEIQHA